jgi:tyrosyl-tRNA synthetase
LRYFTFLDVAEIAAIEEADQQAQGKPQAQKILAEEVARLVHGDDALISAKRITDALFDGNISELSVSDLRQLQLDGLPTTQLDSAALGEEPLSSLFVSAGLAKNGKQAKDALTRRAVLVNGRETGWDDNMAAATIFDKDKGLFQQWFIVKLGKKSYHLFTLA